MIQQACALVFTQGNENLCPHRNVHGCLKAALFIVVKTWKQTRCTSVGEWINKLWNEVHDIVQETGIKTISIENKCKNAKWLSGEALQIAHTLYICIFMSYFIWSHHFMGNR